MSSETRYLRPIWDQETIPIVLRRTVKGEKIRLRLPFASDNRKWLRNGRKNYLDWNEQGRYWEIPKAWFNDFVDRALQRYGWIYVVQPYRESEVCARACMEATSHECQCSCMGVNHGSGFHGNWIEISDYFALKWRDRKLACRLMSLKDKKNPKFLAF